MSKVDRRDFFKTSAPGAAAAVLSSNTAAQEAVAQTHDTMPGHRVMLPYGFHAYTDKLSIEPGETVAFHVSSTVRYKLAIARLGEEVDDPASDDVLYEYDESPPVPQVIRPGSYVHIEKGLPADQPLNALTLECWVRAYPSSDPIGLLTQFDMPDSCGYGLLITAGGSIGFYLGDGGRYDMHSLRMASGPPIPRRKWLHVVGTWDGKKMALYIDAEKRGEWDFEGPVQPGNGTLRLGARGDWGDAWRFLDGDLAMPAIYDRALSQAEIARRFKEEGLQEAKGDSVIGCWPLAEERGEQVADTSGHERHGQIVNHGTWMVGGPSHDAAVPRYGNYDPAKDPRRGHGLRLATDDIYDCRWKPVQHWKAPRTAKSGFYVGRFKYVLDGKPRIYHALFFVKRPKASKNKPPVVLLAATNTYRAYTYRPFAEVPPRLKWNDGSIRNSVGDPPEYSMYNGHKAGQVAYQLGLRLPSPNSGPYVNSMGGGLEHNYSHLARADRLTEVWLAKTGYEYDVITDLDLHQDPDILKGYEVLVINGHSEYWSIEAYNGVKRFLEEDKGDVVVMSGNTMFWRVTWNDDGTIMECRKIDAPGNPIDAAYRGESWHSMDGQRGGLMRDCGYPAWKVLGLECLGWDGSVDAIGPFVAKNVDHFLYNEPEPTGLKEDEEFGTAPDGGYPKAGGHEYDVRVSTLKRLQQGPIPEGAVDPVEPEGIDYLGYSIHKWKPFAATFDYYTRAVPGEENLGGEIVLWNRPDGGRVFHAGVIAGGWVLQVDPKFQTMMRNVFHHFGVQPKKA